MLGSALCVFNSNNAFIIENILKNDPTGIKSWFDLVDKESGNLKSDIRETITANYGDEVERQFEEIVDKRNRIVHSYQITDKDNRQKLATKERKGSHQFVITEEYLLEFIADNQKLSDILYSVRRNDNKT